MRSKIWRRSARLEDATRRKWEAAMVGAETCRVAASASVQTPVPSLLSASWTTLSSGMSAVNAWVVEVKQVHLGLR